MHRTAHRVTAAAAKLMAELNVAKRRKLYLRDPSLGIPERTLRRRKRYPRPTPENNTSSLTGSGSYVTDSSSEQSEGESEVLANPCPLQKKLMMLMCIQV